MPPLSHTTIIILTYHGGLMFKKRKEKYVKGNLTLESFLSWLKVKVKHWSNVNYTLENTDSGPQIKVIFKHDLGGNWSIYHKIILEYIFY